MAYIFTIEVWSYDEIQKQWKILKVFMNQRENRYLLWTIWRIETNLKNLPLVCYYYYRPLPPIYLNWIFPILQFEISSLINWIFSQFKTNSIFFPVQSDFFFFKFMARVKYFDGPCLTIYSLSQFTEIYITSFWSGRFTTLTAVNQRNWNLGLSIFFHFEMTFLTTLTRFLNWYFVFS